MLIELLRALALAGPPVFAASFALAWWGLRRGAISDTTGVSALDREFKAMKKLKKERPRGDAVHEKWLKFGGGFYGVVGLMTWVWIEVVELPSDLLGLVRSVFTLDLGGVIRFFVDSFMNFIAAIAWPAWWLQRIHSPAPWAWFLAAWLGYWAGVRLAQTVHARRTGNGL